MSATAHQNLHSKRVLEDWDALEPPELSGGLDPEERQLTAGNVLASVNEDAVRREHVERDNVVQEWLLGLNKQDPFDDSVVVDSPHLDSVRAGDWASHLAGHSVNAPTAGQVFFRDRGGGLTEPELDILRQRPWLDAPLVLDIATDRGVGHRYQPESSQAAISKYQTQCHDNDSVVSKAATKGTRRNSLPARIVDDEISLGPVLNQARAPGGHGPVSDSPGTVENRGGQSSSARSSRSFKIESRVELSPTTQLDATAKIEPTFTGFREHILQLNPGIIDKPYLVDRIAHQQVIRYKSLLNSRIAHLKAGSLCNSGAHCTKIGGVATALDMDNEEGEHLITPESFPSYIPMPSTTKLPAMFECQLCYQVKKFRKPIDWTKHIHEDIQPYTCTWDKCRDPKMYKRKADWIRHENEGHRRLEWWTCDVEDCGHTCYRRDNFVQHLVREHKFSEPKVKPKSVIDTAQGSDSIWDKVEGCRHETKQKPQDEACRFCSKKIPSWRNLIAHTAKHMEQIASSVISLAEAAQVQPESIISPAISPQSAMPLPLPLPLPLPSSLASNAYQSWDAGHRQDQSWFSPLASTGTPQDEPLFFQDFASNTAALPTPYQYSSGSSISRPRVPEHSEKSPIMAGLVGSLRPKRGKSSGKPAPFGARSPIERVLTPVYTPQSIRTCTVAPFDAQPWYKMPGYGALSTVPSKADSLFTPSISGSQDAQREEAEMRASCSDRGGFLNAKHSGTDVIPSNNTKDAATQTLVGEDPTYAQPQILGGQSPVPEDHGAVSSPESSSSVQSATKSLPGPARGMRQVGVAKIAMQLLSFSPQYNSRMAGRLREDEGDYDSADDWEDENCVDDDDVDPSSSKNTNNPASNLAQTDSGSHPATSCRPLRRERPDGDEGEGDDERQQKRPKGHRGNKSQTPPQQRFACPYQAFESWRDCFRPTRRNPGGCDGIKRLKHHLIRRHMMSQRCNRCWISVATSQRLEEHQRDGKCKQTEKPTGECFMELELEEMVRESHGALSEDVWWNLFQLLIPGKQHADLSVLKREYYPFYISIDSSLMIPALTFSDGSFSFGDMTSATLGPDESSTALDEGFTNMLSNDNMAFQLESGSQPTDGAPIAALQSFAVPIYAMPMTGHSSTSDTPAVTHIESGTAAPDQYNTTSNNNSSVNIHPSGFGMSSVSDISYPTMPFSTAPTPIDTPYLSSNTAMPTPSSTTISVLTAPELTQLQREYDILKLRNTQMAEECNEARDAMRASRVEIDNVQGMLYNVLGMPQVQGEVYGQLLNIVKLVAVISKKLK